ADEQIAHRGKDIVLDSWQRDEEVGRVRDVLLEADRPQGPDRHAEVGVLLLAVRQARTIRGIAAEVVADVGRDEPVGVCGSGAERHQCTGTRESGESSHSRPPPPIMAQSAGHAKGTALTMWPSTLEDLIDD